MSIRGCTDDDSARVAAIVYAGAAAVVTRLNVAPAGVKEAVVEGIVDGARVRMGFRNSVLPAQSNV